MNLEELIINRSFITLALLFVIILYIYHLSDVQKRKNDKNNPSENDLTIEQLEEKLQNGEITIKEYIASLEKFSKKDYRKS